MDNITYYASDPFLSVSGWVAAQALRKFNLDSGICSRKDFLMWYPPVPKIVKPVETRHSVLLRNFNNSMNSSKWSG